MGELHEKPATGPTEQNDKAARDAANIKLAIGLGLLAVGVYVGFLLIYAL